MVVRATRKNPSGNCGHNRGGFSSRGHGRGGRGGIRNHGVDVVDRVFVAAVVAMGLGVTGVGVLVQVFVSGGAKQIAHVDKVVLVLLVEGVEEGGILIQASWFVRE